MKFVIAVKEIAIYASGDLARVIKLFLFLLLCVRCELMLVIAALDARKEGGVDL